MSISFRAALSAAAAVAAVLAVTPVAAAPEAPALQINLMSQLDGALPGFVSRSFGAGVATAHGWGEATPGTTNAWAVPWAAACISTCPTATPTRTRVNTELAGDAGVVNAYSYTNLAGYSGASTKLIDTLQVPGGSQSLQFRIHLEDVAMGVAGTDAAAGLWYALWTMDSSGFYQPLFQLWASSRVVGGVEQPLSAYYTTAAGSTPVAQLQPSFDFSIAAPAVGNTLSLWWAVSTNSQAAAGSSSFIDLGKGAFLGIDGNFTSSLGLDYTGYVAAVPEPGGAAIWLAGLAVLSLVSRQRKLARRREPTARAA